MSITAAELIAKVVADTGQAERDLRDFGNRVSNQTGSVFKGNIASSAVNTLSRGIMDLGRVGVGVFADMVSSGADFEAQMDGVSAVLGGTQEQADALSKLAIDLAIDPNLKVDATQAAAAIENLATAGLSADQILSGATKATILLANSTGGDFGQAATVATDVMSLFNIKAEDMMGAVDGIASVSNVSKFDLNDYALAISQAGGVASLSGVSFEDFNATIAATAPYFASGSDAGTSFKTFLQRLNPTTKEAKDLMAELNLLTEDGTSIFYDSTGQLKDMVEITGIMNSTFGDMTESQKSFYLGQLFGTDAMRTAGAVADMTTTEYVDLKNAMADTSALDAAKQRTDNFKSSMENLQGALDAVKLSVWDKIKGPAQELVLAVAPVIDWVAPVAVDYAEQLGDWISDQVANVRATASVVWDVSEGDLRTTIMASLGRLTGADIKIDANAEIVGVDWGFFKYVYDATSRVTHVDFGDASYTFDAEANVGSLTFAGHTITGEGDHPIRLAVELFATQLPGSGKGLGTRWMRDLLPDPNEAGKSFRAAFLSAMDATTLTEAVGNIPVKVKAWWGDEWTKTREALVQLQADWGTTWTNVYSVVAPIAADWGATWTQVYNANAGIMPDWGATWTATYEATAKIIADWGDTWSKIYEATGIAKINDWINGVGTVTLPGRVVVTETTGAAAGSDSPYYTGDRADPGAPPVRRRATGDPLFSGGWTWTGERGPELVRLPGGSRIFDAKESAAMAGGSTVVNNYNVVRQPHDIELLAQRVAAHIGRRGR